MNFMNVVTGAGLGVLFVCAAASAQADILPPQPIPPPVVGFLDGAEPACFVRAYDAAHMKAHPRQKVEAIAFSYTPYKHFEGESKPQPMWDQFSDASGLNGLLAARLKGEPGVLLAGVSCRTGSSRMLECGVEGDGGLFDMLLQPDGRVKLRNPEGLALQSPTADPDAPDDGVIRIEAADDHAAFLLAPGSGGLCDADWPSQP